MKLAALRYSPEMALAFQPTLTLRPATKKSEAVFDFLADQKPIPIVATTVRALKARMKGSMLMALAWNRKGAETQRGDSFSRLPLRLCASAVYLLNLRFLQRNRPADEHPRDHPHEGEEQHAE